jgi:hypothetical protein
MTIRSRLEAIRRNTMIVSMVAWLLFAGGMAATAVDSRFLVVVILAFFAFMGAVLFSLFGIRCPKCRGALGYALQWPPKWFGISEKIRFCLFCGVELDAELDAELDGPDSIPKVPPGGV